MQELKDWKIVATLETNVIKYDGQPPDKRCMYLVVAEDENDYLGVRVTQTANSFWNIPLHNQYFRKGLSHLIISKPVKLNKGWKDLRDQFALVPPDKEYILGKMAKSKLFRSPYKGIINFKKDVKK